MENTNHISIPLSTAVIIQSSSSTTTIDSKSLKLVFRLGWISFIFGACAFLIHYISIDHLANFSPFNAGIISGFFLMIAGLASVAAGYQETSYRCFIHAQIWSFIVNILLAPGLIAVSIAALIIDSEDLRSICEPPVLSSRFILFGHGLEIYPSDIPCLKTRNRFNLTQILNTTQLIIGLICFLVHVILLSIQRKIIKQMKTDPNKFSGYIESNIIDTSKSNKFETIVAECYLYLDPSTCYTDPPPKYEDLPSIKTISE
jgi:hypothetical protein